MLTDMLTKNEKVYNGLWYASFSALLGIPAGSYLTNSILKRFDLDKCKHTRKALNEQMNTIVSVAVILGYFYGYSRHKKQN